jgi:predicted ATP-binding protein involved in virulence
MYLRECLIENIGPIAALDLSFELDPGGNPKPVILVGKNGTGKTIVLAYILDAMAELAKEHFGDIVLDQRVGHLPFVKMSSGGESITFRFSRLPVGVRRCRSAIQLRRKGRPA